MNRIPPKKKVVFFNEDDPKGVKVYCDAGVPSFNPLDYNKDELKFEYEAEVPPVNHHQMLQR